MIGQVPDGLQGAVRVHLHVRRRASKAAGGGDQRLKTGGMFKAEIPLLRGVKKTDDLRFRLPVFHRIEDRQGHDALAEIRLRELSFLIGIRDEIQQVVTDLEHVSEVDPELLQLQLHLLAAAALHGAGHAGQSTERRRLAVNIAHILPDGRPLIPSTFHLAQLTDTHGFHSLTDHLTDTGEAVTEQALDDPAQEQVTGIDGHVLAVFGLGRRQSPAEGRVIDNIVMNERSHMHQLNQGAQTTELAAGGLKILPVSAGHQQETGPQALASGLLHIAEDPADSAPVTGIAQILRQVHLHLLHLLLQFLFLKLVHRFPFMILP